MNILGCKNPPTCNPRCNYELLAELRNLLVQTIKQVTNGHSIYLHTAHHLLCPLHSFQAFFEIPHGILIFRAFTGHAEPSAAYFLPVLFTFSHRHPLLFYSTCHLSILTDTRSIPFKQSLSQIIHIQRISSSHISHN